MHPSHLIYIFYVSKKFYFCLWQEEKQKKDSLQTRSANERVSERKVKGKKSVEIGSEKKGFQINYELRYEKLKKSLRLHCKMKNEY